MTTASVAHWNCTIEHPPQQGYREGRMHRRGCNVAEGHETGTTSLECRACRTHHNPPPKTSKRVYAETRHYACEIGKWDHDPPLRRYARGGHQEGCATLPNHVGGAGLQCPGCRAVYAGKNDALMAVGSSNDDPHWSCTLPTDQHAIWPGKGYGHRRGCDVAEGHTPDVEIKGCIRCRRERYKHSARPASLKKRYALTPEQYEALLEQQDHRCAICREPEKDGRNLSVDHNHATLENRGLLCYRCNLGLGYFRDREDWLTSAAEYLRQRRA